MNQNTFIPAIRSNIIETTSITSLLDHIDHHETLVIFDIDNTILELPDGKGSPQWVMALIKHGQSLGLDYTQAYNIIKPVIHDIFMTTVVKPVEPETALIIAQLQQQNIHVIGLTARSTPTVNDTIKHLDSIAISLKSTGLSLKSPLEIAHLPFPNEIQYQEGILFCGFNPKGSMLQTLLKSTAYTPEKIIFVDDQIKDLASVEKTAAEMKIPFIGFHYTHLAEKVHNFVLDEETKHMIFQSPDSKLPDSITITPPNSL